jgi:hypothetical protein
VPVQFKKENDSAMGLNRSTRPAAAGKRSHVCLEAVEAARDEVTTTNHPKKNK